MSDLLEHNNLLGCEFVEPFAGGAGAAIELLLSNKIGKLILNDYSRSVWAFWKCVLHRTQILCNRINSATFSLEEWEKQRKVQHFSNAPVDDLGFSTLYLNRVNYSGIISGGLIGGKMQNGPYKMNCRFNKENLIEKIKSIAVYKNRIKLYRLDCAKFLAQRNLFSETSFFFMDPPYYNVGNKLYLSNFIHANHEILATIVSNLQHPWIMTYDCCPEINHIYASRERIQFTLNYSANVKCKGTEILMWSERLELPYRI